ncbi:MAG TPA: hypothetical protein VIL74_12145 [Pyrinomonadaceae bacterium]
MESAVENDGERWRVNFTIPMWEKVKFPVLLVWGDKNTVVPVAESRTIIPNALKKAGTTT